ncbi:hypothetical protein [Chengkuizengella marina]|uniref:Uncharacterized protein n=1 Tax=Chengkuizengella marina TaxID=2507566 RepID=A0A6N9Q5K8_9BACL|nr:hypothetical protein [Chengkuizengella marina]NBI30102.1 hypothetical protein [Chengkuizengella marina]
MKKVYISIISLLALYILFSKLYLIDDFYKTNKNMMMFFRKEGIIFLEVNKLKNELKSSFMEKV